MQITATDNIMVDNETTKVAGDTFDLPDAQAEQLIALGVATPAVQGAANTAGPLDGQVASQVGNESLPPQSQPVPQPTQPMAPSQPLQQPMPNGFPQPQPAPQQPTEAQIAQDMARLDGPSLG